MSLFNLFMDERIDSLQRDLTNAHQINQVADCVVRLTDAVIAQQKRINALEALVLDLGATIKGKQ